MYPKKHIKIKGKEMAYVDEGQGDPIVFLHGNPASSFLWRNITPYVEGMGRIIVPDLIGMGDSEKLDGIDNPDYKYHGQYKYLSTLLDSLELGDQINLVIHDWGSAMGFQFARENPDRIKSITYMEAIVMPLTWEQWPDAATKIFGLFRSEAGEELVLEKNFFVERILLADSATGYTDEEKAEYIRHGTKWNVVEDNIKTLMLEPNVNLQISTTVTLLNYLTLDDFYKFVEKTKIHLIMHGK